ncbi:unnamed protein product, partial [Ilex paraguariensis]
MARSLECTLTLFLVFLLFGSSFFEARPLDVSKPPNNIEEAMEEVLKGSNFEVSKTKGTTARTLVQIKEAGPSPPGQGHHQSPHGPPPSPGSDEESWPTNRSFLIKGPAKDVTTYLGLEMNSGVEARRLEIQPIELRLIFQKRKLNQLQ